MKFGKMLEKIKKKNFIFSQIIIKKKNILIRSLTFLIFVILTLVFSFKHNFQLQFFILLFLLTNVNKNISLKNRTQQNARSYSKLSLQFSLNYSQKFMTNIFWFTRDNTFVFVHFLETWQILLPFTCTFSKINVK